VAYFDGNDWYTLNVNGWPTLHVNDWYSMDVNGWPIFMLFCMKLNGLRKNGQLNSPFLTEKVATQNLPKQDLFVMPVTGLK